MMDIAPNSGQTEKTVMAPGKKKSKGKGGRILRRLLLLLALAAIVGLFAWAEMQRREVSQELEQTRNELEEIRKFSQSSGEEIAEEVLRNVRQLMDLPEDPKPVVATIVDVDSLRAVNVFYDQAENGDHLIITENRAILYDPDRNIIIDVVPVQVEEEVDPTPTPEAVE